MLIEACNQLMLTQEHTNHLKAHRFQTFFTPIHFEMVSNMDANQTKPSHLPLGQIVRCMTSFRPTFCRLHTCSRNQPVVVIPDISQVNCALFLTYT